MKEFGSMASPEVRTMLNDGFEKWNAWRQKGGHPSLRDSTFIDEDFSKFDFTGVDLSGSKLFSCQFNETIVNGCNFSDAFITNSKFHASKGAANCERTHFHECMFLSSDFSNAVFVKAYFKECDFLAAIFTGASFDQAALRGARFSSASLNKAHFNGADLEGARFGGSWLEDTSFVDADLSDASVKGTAVNKGTSFARARVEGLEIDRL